MISLQSSEVDQAIAILLARGAREVYIFGSRARGNARPGSDLDLAVRGMAPECFYGAVGELCSALSMPVDLVDLDDSGPSLDYLKKHGDFLRVA
jgi:predicted nucleotidyltransferase